MTYKKTAKDLAFEKDKQKLNSDIKNLRTINYKLREEINSLNQEIETRDLDILRLKKENAKLLEMCEMTEVELKSVLKSATSLNTLSDMIGVFGKMY